MSTIAAGTTLTTALVQTGDTTGTLVIQTNGTTTAATFDTSQNMTVTGSVRTNNILDASGGNTATINSMTPTADSLQGFRNRIINGDMRIDQRNAGASVTVNSTTEVFPVDRFVANGQVTDGVFTLQRSTTAPSGFTNSLLATVTTADTSIGSTQYYFLQQKIEGFNVADLGFGTASAKTVTLSFWVRSSVTGTFGGSLSNNAANRSYPFSYTINSANTFEYKTVTIAGDTTGTWLTDNGVGLRVYFNIGAGSSYTTTAGAWASQWAFNATGATNLIATNGATFYITGVQLEVGSTATPFERRDYGRELIMCQRYLPGYVYSSASGSEMIGWARGGSASSIASTQIVFPVTARVPPTGVSVTGSSWAVSGVAFTTVAFSTSSTGVGHLDLSGGSGMTALAMYTFTSSATGSRILFTGCEL